MKYIYKIAIVFLLFLIIWNFFKNSTSEYFSKREKKYLQAAQNYNNIIKPYLTKYKRIDFDFKNVSKTDIKNLMKFQKDMSKISISPKQMKKIQSEIRRRNPWMPAQA
jgi:hypothetical protein